MKNARLFGILLFLFCISGAATSSITAQSAESLPLGTFVPVPSTDSSCPRGFICSGFEVTCSGVTGQAPGFIAIAEATAPPRGVVSFFTGGSGMGWWSGNDPALLAFTDDLRALGYTIVQVRWATNWLETSAGNDAGTSRLGCRPATVIRHIHDTVYEPLGLDPAAGACGFCITGYSGGATQVSYALSHRRPTGQTRLFK